VVKKRVLPVVIVVGIVFLMGLTAAHAAERSSATIAVQEFKFAPSVLTVRVGTTVTWTNHDEETHTVTSATGAFASAGLGHEEGFSQIFTRPGRYEYFCALHPHMKATVIVR
jgi:plastocyanin